MRCCVLCVSVTGEDRWPVSAPLAEGAQPRAGERTLDKRGGSKGKRSWEFLLWTERGMTTNVNDRWDRRKMWGVSGAYSKWKNKFHNMQCIFNLQNNTSCAHTQMYVSPKTSFSFLKSKSMTNKRLSMSLVWSRALLCTVGNSNVFPGSKMSNAFLKWITIL